MTSKALAMALVAATLALGTPASAASWKTWGGFWSNVSTSLGLNRRDYLQQQAEIATSQRYSRRPMPRPAYITSQRFGGHTTSDGACYGQGCN